MLGYGKKEGCMRKTYEDARKFVNDPYPAKGKKFEVSDIPILK